MRKYERIAPAPDEALDVVPELYKDHWSDMDRSISTELVELRSESAIDQLTEIYDKPSNGSYRAGFFDPDANCYIKVPLSLDGVFHNFSELEQYSDGSPPIEMAECWIDFELSEEYQLPIIRMEALLLWEDYYTAERLPSWVHLIDGMQVGVHPRTFEILAYDYAW